MESEVIYYSIAVAALITTATFLIIRKLINSSGTCRFPPSPPSLPIIGHFHLVQKPYHRSLQSLISKYGPILYLRLGRCRILVISTPEAAEECFTKSNDVAFANRPNFLPGKILGYNFSNMVWAPYGDHWRNLRRITAHEVFSPNSLQNTSWIRVEEVRRLAGEIYRNCKELTVGKEGAVIDLNRALFLLTQNIVMRMVSGKRWPVDGQTADDKLFSSRTGFMTVCDFFPVLRWVGGVERGLKKLCGDRDRFLQGLINDELDRKKEENELGGGEEHKTTIVEWMLMLQRSDPDYYTDDVIKGNILLMFSAGSETSSHTIEWAMSLLLTHPTIFQKAREEIDAHIGQDQDRRLVGDSDLSKLPYLHCILNETLRLFPAAPLLLPHYSSSDVTICGYHVPRGTMLWVNAWAMHRDPKVWEDPLVFKPERFYDGWSNAVIDDDGDKRSNNSSRFRYIPFGVGRRVCPGTNMALRIMTLTVATLIQCFDWEKIRMEDGGGGGTVDLKEKVVGATLPKNEPLRAICRVRPRMTTLLSQL